MDQDAALIDELVVANHILFSQGVVDGFGHVSARHPGRADRFLLARSMAPALTEAADILEYDLDANAVAADAPTGYLERYIHSEIYRARPDVMAVVHSHSPSVVPFSVVTGVPLRPLSHTCGFLGEGVPIFEIRDHAGEASDLLIRNPALGVALAKSLEDHAAILMRGHGSTVVGATLRQTVFQAVYTELGARLQSEAMRLGPVTYLTAGEAASTWEMNSQQVSRAWDLWAREAARA